LGGIGYALMNQSESAIVAIVLRPELTTVLSFTRKLLEVGKNIIDMIAFSAYGGIAHLVASDQRQRVLRVHAEITTLRLSFAIIAAAAFLVADASVVAAWVGPSEFGGATLTILLAIQFLVVGQSFLLNYLYRGLGPVAKGSVALLAECILRVPLIVASAAIFGLTGVPLAGIVTGAIFGVITLRWTRREVLEFAEPAPKTPPAVWGVRLGILMGSALMCIFVHHDSWLYAGFAGTTTALIAAICLVYTDATLRMTLEPIRLLLIRWVPSAD
jgi:O-antigen/teichoic acid export membrane protein